MIIKSTDNKNSALESIKKAHQLQEKLNAFVTIIDEPNHLDNKNSSLNNVPYATKDNIVTKNILTTASSNTLKNYIPIFNATVIEKLNAAGAINIGKTVLDELGMGGTGLTGHTGIVHNPWDINRIAGGSSAGSTVAVATGIVPFALGSDTGDSIRKPAAFCGIVGYKPTYGLISRFGLIPFASSLDHIGVLTTNVYDAAFVVNTIKGIDPRDMTTFNSSELNLITDLENINKDYKLFYIKELCNIDYYDEPTEQIKKILSDFHNTITKIKDYGISVNEVSIDINILKAIKPAYDCISSAEANSNNANLTGIIFGPREESENYKQMIFTYRTKNFSSLIKRRFIIGKYVLTKENQEKYFLNACRLRRMITDNINQYFSEYDGLIMPAAADIAPKINEADDQIKEGNIALDNNLIIGNFGGFPSITIPSSMVDNMPVGINITGPIMMDKKVLSIAYQIESILPYKGQTVKEVD